MDIRFHPSENHIRFCRKGNGGGESYGGRGFSSRADIYCSLPFKREREKKEKEEEKTFSTSRRPYTLGIASRARHVGAPHSPCSACVGPFPGRFCNLPAPSWRRARPHLSPAFSLFFPSYNIHFASREIEIAWVDLG